MGILTPTVPRDLYDALQARYDDLLNKYGIESRLWPHCVPEPNTGCWLWERSARPSGYGQIHVAGRPLGTHRVAYEAVHGPIPAGLEVCHSCDQPACINPAHLFLGTHADNMVDMRRKGRSKAGRYLSDRSACVNGHDFTEKNTIRRADGSRKCRECSRDYMRRKRARLAA